VLASVYLAVTEVSRELPLPAQEKLGRIWQLLDQVDEQLRRLSHELRPTILDDLGLLPAVEFLAEGVGKRTGLLVTVKGSTEGRLPPALETVLYRIVQEGLTNMTRHAHAPTASVEFQRDASAIRCIIRDDGVGFDVSAVHGRRGKRGLGLLGIRERLSAHGGSLQINSAPGRGTELAITLLLRA
jgi:signal transduction histidine kinase